MIDDTGSPEKQLRVQQILGGLTVPTQLMAPLVIRRINVVRK